MTMEELKIKYAPAIKDLTVGSKEPEDDEGMEAVLWEKGDKVEESKSDGRFMTHEKSEDAQLFDMIRRKDWKALMCRCQAHPHLAYVKFSRNSAMSKGNLVLHEICKHCPPIDVVETFYEANDSAVMIRGYGGYLPLHHACANGASDDVIQYLLSKYPEALSVADENEHMLPLHLICKVGASEDTFMLLLSYYPEAASSKDDFGRLPLDYAKNIRSAGSRDIAIKCLNFAKWLKTSTIYARRKTEKEYESRIRGYEECQAQHLKMIKEVHDEEIAELENAVLAQQKDFSKKLNLLTELQQDLKKKEKEIEKQAASLTKIQVIVDLKKVEVDELSKKLAKANKRVEKMSRKLEDRSSELELATQDIEILNQHSEWLETALGSIRKIANTEAPLVRSLHQREESSREWEQSHSQGVARVPAVKKFETAIPRFGKKHVPADEGAFNKMDDDRSEDCDSELHSVTREGAE